MTAYTIALSLVSSLGIAVGSGNSPAADISRISRESFCSAAAAAAVAERLNDDIAESVREAQQEEENKDDEETAGETVACFSEDFDSSFKAYMDYRCITDTDSVQYSLQQEAYSDDRGFRRIGDDYCVALGTGITGGCGERFLISLDSGCSFTAIVSDIKADIHTDSTNCYAPLGDNAGNVVEFIIDTDCADDYMLSCGSAGCFDDLSGNVVSIERI